MVVQEEVKILFPVINNGFTGEEISFVINQMKCRTLAVVYFKLHCYDLNDDEILINNDAVHIGERWVVDSDYSSYVSTFELDKNILLDTKKLQLELRFIGVDDDNPLYMTEIMLMNGSFTEYHSPNEDVGETSIGFINNAYANLYSNNREGDYLQVIRPTKNPFTTKTLSKCAETVLVPHITGETEHDKPHNIFMEYINQTEQVTNIDLR